MYFTMRVSIVQNVSFREQFNLWQRFCKSQHTGWLMRIKITFKSACKSFAYTLPQLSTTGTLRRRELPDEGRGTFFASIITSRHLLIVTRVLKFDLFLPMTCRVSPKTSVCMLEPVQVCVQWQVWTNPVNEWRVQDQGASHRMFPGILPLKLQLMAHYGSPSGHVHCPLLRYVECKTKSCAIENDHSSNIRRKQHPSQAWLREKQLPVMATWV